jgi:hypothetical protein
MTDKNITRCATICLSVTDSVLLGFVALQPRLCRRFGARQIPRSRIACATVMHASETRLSGSTASERSLRSSQGQLSVSYMKHPNFPPIARGKTSPCSLACMIESAANIGATGTRRTKPWHRTLASVGRVSTTIVARTTATSLRLAPVINVVHSSISFSFV